MWLVKHEEGEMPLWVYRGETKHFSCVYIGTVLTTKITLVYSDFARFCSFNINELKINRVVSVSQMVKYDFVFETFKWIKAISLATLAMHSIAQQFITYFHFHHFYYYFFSEKYIQQIYFFSKKHIFYFQETNRRYNIRLSAYSASNQIFTLCMHSACFSYHVAGIMLLFAEYFQTGLRKYNQILCVINQIWLEMILLRGWGCGGGVFYVVHIHRHRRY